MCFQMTRPLQLAQSLLYLALQLRDVTRKRQHGQELKREGDVKETRSQEQEMEQETTTKGTNVTGQRGQEIVFFHAQVVSHTSQKGT